MAPRRTRSALDSEGTRGETGVRLRNGRYYRGPEEPRGAGGLSDRLRDFQRHASRRALSERVQLADARTVRASPIALVGRASGAVSWRDLLLRRPGSPLGHQVDPEGVER